MRCAVPLLIFLAVVASHAAADEEPPLTFLFRGQKTLLNAPVGEFREVVRSLAFWKGETWVGTYGRGIFAIGGTASAPSLKNLTTATSSLAEARVNCLETVGNDLWIGTCNGINRIDGRTGAWSRHGKADGVAHHIYHTIRGDPDGTVWVGTTGHGISRWDGKSWRSWGTDDGLPSGWVNEIARDGAGKLWAATAGGVATLEGERWRSVPPKNGIGRIWTHATALALADDEMWVGTGRQGMLMYASGYWYSPGGEAHLPSLEVSHLLTARDGALWIATAGGIVRYRRGESWRRYGAAEGLEDKHVMILREGGTPPRIWAGSYGGLVYRLDPEKDRWVTVLRRGALEATGGEPRGGK